MFSRARIFGHPVHPMLIPLPIGAYIFSMLSLIVFALSGDRFWLAAGYWLSIAGVAAALVAAVPGLVDLATIPGDAVARPLGIWHMVLNLSIAVLFFVSWLLLGGLNGPVALDATAPLVLEILGAAWLVVAGWLGWEMVYHHHVAIEPVSAEERRMVEEYERPRRAA